MPKNHPYTKTILLYQKIGFPASPFRVGLLALNASKRYDSTTQGCDRYRIKGIIAGLKSQSSTNLE
jgi:hypothetical protein